MVGGMKIRKSESAKEDSLSPSSSPHLKKIKPDGKLWFKQVQESLFKSALTAETSTDASKNRKPNLDVKNVPRRSALEPALMWRKLQRERQKKILLEAEASFLRASVLQSQKMIEEKSEEIKSMDERVNKLVVELTMLGEGHELLEEEIDIENLLHTKIEDHVMEDILGTLDLTFPADLIDLELQITNSMPQLSATESMGQLRQLSPVDAEEASKPVVTNEHKSARKPLGGDRMGKMHTKQQRSMPSLLAHSMKQQLTPSLECSRSDYKPGDDEDFMQHVMENTNEVPTMTKQGRCASAS